MAVAPFRKPQGPPDPPSGDGEIRERLARLEQKVDDMKDDMHANMATKTDISNLKVWILCGVLSAIGIAATIATIVVKGFFAT